MSFGGDIRSLLDKLEFAIILRTHLIRQEVPLSYRISAVDRDLAEIEDSSLESLRLQHALCAVLLHSYDSYGGFGRGKVDIEGSIALVKVKMKTFNIESPVKTRAFEDTSRDDAEELYTQLRRLWRDSSNQVTWTAERDSNAQSTQPSQMSSEEKLRYLLDKLEFAMVAYLHRINLHLKIDHRMHRMKRIVNLRQEFYLGQVYVKYRVTAVLLHAINGCGGLAKGQIHIENSVQAVEIQMESSNLEQIADTRAMLETTSRVELEEVFIETRRYFRAGHPDYVPTNEMERLARLEGFVGNPDTGARARGTYCPGSENCLYCAGLDAQPSTLHVDRTSECNTPVTRRRSG